jgi:hypothetical protein
MEEQLQRLIELQTEQNQLQKKHLVRIRFSLLTLLLLTTAVCCCLGYVMYMLRSPRVVVLPAGLSGPTVTRSQATAPTYRAAAPYNARPAPPPPASNRK